MRYLQYLVVDGQECDGDCRCEQGRQVGVGNCLSQVVVGEGHVEGALVARDSDPQQVLQLRREGVEGGAGTGTIA